jgi:hypothetical protein
MNVIPVALRRRLEAHLAKRDRKRKPPKHHATVRNCHEDKALARKP